MTVQALAKKYFEVENRSYAEGVVVTFGNDGVGGWVVGNGWADATPSVVAAAIAAGAVQKTHTAGYPARRRAMEMYDDPDSGLPTLSGPSADAVRGAKPVGRSTKIADIKFATDNAGSNVGKTFEHVRSVPFAFAGGRLIAYSSGAAQASGVLRAAVSSQAAYNSASDAAPIDVTWNGSTSPGGGGVFTATRGTDGIMLGLSDPFTLASAARSDGGLGGILAIRVEAAASGAFIFSLRPSSGTPGTQYNTGASYVDYSREATGQYVSTNKAGFAGAAATNANGNLIIMDAILFESSRVFSIGQGGDSLAQGQYGLRSSENDVKIACDALTLAGIANVVYCGGATMPAKGVATYAYRSLEFINKVKPDGFVYQFWSPNDGSITNAAVLNQSRSYLYQIIDSCVRNGTALVARTPPLWQLFNATDYGNALAYHAEIRTLCANAGVQFLDIYTPTANTSVSPPTLVAGYGWPSGSASEMAHLAETGYNAVAPLTQAVIRKALAI